jgi:hypothetical protein
MAVQQILPDEETLQRPEHKRTALMRVQCLDLGRQFCTVRLTVRAEQFAFLI